MAPRPPLGSTAYAAFLRGVSPMNAKMPELKRCFEAAGFSEVKTVLSSGNVVFRARRRSEGSLERAAEKAMEEGLGRSFLTVVRRVEALQEILDTNPYQGFRLAPGAKRIVTFLRGQPKARLALPLEVNGARVLRRRGAEVFSAYVPQPGAAVFMAVIEKTFGKAVTTRTWETVQKVVRASAASGPPSPS